MLRDQATNDVLGGRLPQSLELIAFQKGSEFEAHDRARAFALYKITLRPVIERAFGWDESFQLGRFSEKYPTEWFHWIHHMGSEVGFIAHHTTDADLHLSLLVLAPEHQKKGIGAQAMSQIHTLAREKKMSVSLSSFKTNVDAIRFYEHLGYVQTGSDEYFVDFTFSNPHLESPLSPEPSRR